MPFVRWVFVKEHSQPQFLNHALPLVMAHLGKPGYHQKERVIRYLGNFIQEDGAILKAQNLFCVPIPSGLSQHDITDVLGLLTHPLSGSGGYCLAAQKGVDVGQESLSAGGNR